MKTYHIIKKTRGFKILVCLIFLAAIFYEVSSDSILWKNSSELKKDVRTQTFFSLDGKNIEKLSFVQVLRQRNVYKNSVPRRCKRITVNEQAVIYAQALCIFFLLCIRARRSERKNAAGKYVKALSGKRAPPALSYYC